MPSRGFFARRAVDGITAVSEATFPKNEIGAPDFASTKMVERTLEYLDELPEKQQRLLTALFVFVELAAIFLVLGFRRFSKIPVARRTEVIRGWRRSRFTLLRVLGDALKATSTMMYMSHPSVVSYIEEFRVCRHPHDRIVTDVRPGALEAMTTEPAATEAPASAEAAER